MSQAQNDLKLFPGCIYTGWPPQSSSPSASWWVTFTSCRGSITRHCKLSAHFRFRTNKMAGGNTTIFFTPLPLLKMSDQKLEPSDEARQTPTCQVLCSFLRLIFVFHVISWSVEPRSHLSTQIKFCLPTCKMDFSLNLYLKSLADNIALKCNQLSSWGYLARTQDENLQFRPHAPS